MTEQLNNSTTEQLNDVVISVKNISKSYRMYSSPTEKFKELLHPFGKKYHQEFWALKDVSFDVTKGECVGIIGRNGSGKSTLLQMICGVLQPTDGEAKVNGRISALLELGAGFNREFSGRDNVHMNGALMGFSRVEMNEKFEAIADFADIGDFIEQPVKTYSSGMYVRLAFACAVNVDPDILIVDEALSVGDMFFQNRCMKKIRQLMDHGCTTLFVSHDTASVKSLCSRGVYLDSGGVKSIGNSGDVCDLYIRDQRERAGFFGQAGDKQNKDMVGDTSGSAAPSVEEERVFEKRAAYFRKGKGDVKIVHAALLDEHGRGITEVDFGQKLTFRAVYRSSIELPELVVAFYVKDKNQLEIVGTNNVYEHGNIENVKAGGTYLVEFSFVNRLKAGNYSITALLADSLNTTAYHDWIDDAAIFRSHDLPGERRWAFVNPPMQFSHSSIQGGQK
jgi:lipopolysaccharide transport system ATP-binding protein